MFISNITFTVCLQIFFTFYQHMRQNPLKVTLNSLPVLSDRLFDFENSTINCFILFTLACIPYLGTKSSGKQPISLIYERYIYRREYSMTNEFYRILSIRYCLLAIQFSLKVISHNGDVWQRRHCTENKVFH